METKDKGWGSVLPFVPTRFCVLFFVGPTALCLALLLIGQVWGLLTPVYLTTLLAFVWLESLVLWFVWSPQNFLLKMYHFRSGFRFGLLHNESLSRVVRLLMVGIALLFAVLLVPLFRKLSEGIQMDLWMIRH